MLTRRAQTDRGIGGISLVLSGVLFLTKSVLEWAAGDPPSTGPEILAWRSSHEVALAWSDELLFVATVLLIPAVIVLYRCLKGPEGIWAAFGCGVLAAVIPVNFALLIVHGRLAFPVYGIIIDDPVVAAFVVSLYYGGMHAVSLLLAGAAIMLGLTMRRGVFGPGVGAVGVAAGAAQIIAAYPWLVSPTLVLACQVLLAVWFVLCGSRLAFYPRRPVSRGSMPPGRGWPGR